MSTHADGVDVLLDGHAGNLEQGLPRAKSAKTKRPAGLEAAFTASESVSARIAVQAALALVLAVTMVSAIILRRQRQQVSSQKWLRPSSVPHAPVLKAHRPRDQVANPSKEPRMNTNPDSKLMSPARWVETGETPM